RAGTRAGAAIGSAAAGAAGKANAVSAGIGSTAAAAKRRCKRAESRVSAVRPTVSHTACTSGPYGNCVAGPWSHGSGASKKSTAAAATAGCAAAATTAADHQVVDVGNAGGIGPVTSADGSERLYGRGSNRKPNHAQRAASQVDRVGRAT